MEGRIGDRPVEESLDADCKRRVEEGLAVIAIAVIYPSDIRKANSLVELEENLAKSFLRVKAFSATTQGDWTTSDLDGLSALLRRSYDMLVEENAVDVAVELLERSIESSVEKLATSPGTEGRLREILIVPKSPD